MGYSTDFSGKISITPPLSVQERDYINAFSASRRVDRVRGPYFVEDVYSGRWDAAHQTAEHEEKRKNITQDVLDHNNPPEGQPGLWCQWVVSEDGKYVQWDGGEKFYAAAEWMAYLVHHFLGPDPVAKKLDPNMDFLQGHKMSGTIYAIGESQSEDVWLLSVQKNGTVQVQQGQWDAQMITKMEQDMEQSDKEYSKVIKKLQKEQAKNPMAMLNYWEKSHQKRIKPLFAALKDSQMISWEPARPIEPGMSQTQQRQLQALSEKSTISKVVDRLVQEQLEKVQAVHKVKPKGL